MIVIIRYILLDEIISKLKGKKGTSVKIKVMRKKKPLDFEIIRDIIKDQTSLCYKFEKQGVYYLSLKIFNELSATQIREILKIANNKKCNGIILDLRRNPGGTLDSSIEMAELFLKKGSVVVFTKTFPDFAPKGEELPPPNILPRPSP